MYVNKYRFDKSNSISTISHRHKRGLYLGLGGILRLDFLAKKEELVVKRGEILVAVARQLSSICGCICCCMRKHIVLPCFSPHLTVCLSVCACLSARFVCLFGVRTSLFYKSERKSQDWWAIAGQMGRSQKQEGRQQSNPQRVPISTFTLLHFYASLGGTWVFLGFEDISKFEIYPFFILKTK